MLEELIYKNHRNEELLFGKRIFLQMKMIFMILPGA